MNEALLEKLRIRPGTPAHYELKTNGGALNMNLFLGRPFALEFYGLISCTECGRQIKKAFGEGFCYPCFINSPETSPCIVRPELCEGHLGKGRDLAWEQANHVQPHTVYLANTSGLKVGVTRDSQIPTRWLDQGAVAAVPLARTPYRQLAGLIEVALKPLTGDRTAWQRMLREDPAPLDLLATRAQLVQALSPEMQQYAVEDSEVLALSYPVLQYPTKVKSLSLDKDHLVQGQLVGLKGQYLIFEDGRVLNIRKHAGYHVRVLTDG